MAKKSKKEEKVTEPKIEKKEYTCNLKVMLTQEELVGMGEAMAEASREKAEAESELTSVKKQIQGKIEMAQLAMNRAADLIRDKFQFRPVDCERVFDYTKGVVTEVRLDTNAEISKRSMTEEEKQMNLPLEERTLAGVAQGQPGQSEPATPFTAPAIGQDQIDKAIDILRATKRASVSSIQRRMRIGYIPACAIMDLLEARGIVGPTRGSDPREILIDLDDLAALAATKDTGDSAE